MTRTRRRSGRLGKTWERIKREPGLGRNISVVAALVTLAGVVGGVILSNQRVSWPWEDSFAFYATLEEVPGVAPGQGQEVRIAGVPVGDLRSTSVDDEGNARLELALDPEQKVYDNATVVLRPKSPMNEMYVELQPGGPPGEVIGSGDVLPLANSQRPIQVEEVLEHLDANVRDSLTALLSEADVALSRAPRQLPEGLDSAHGVVRQLRPVAESLQTRRESLASLVTSLSQIAEAVGDDDARLAQFLDSMQRTFQSLDARGASLDASLGSLPDLTRQLTRAMGAVQELSDQLDPTLENVREASGSLPDSLSTLTATVKRVGETVDIAQPVVTKARPVMSDLRPFAGDLRRAMPPLQSITEQLDPVTGNLVSYLDDLGAFILNTRSLTSLTDGNGGLLRAQVTVGPSSVPSDVLKSLTRSSDR
jgi:phospholipid/cholesterol/gamma-HCH transport system substrate-binding protein